MNKVQLLKELLFESVAKLYANDSCLFFRRGLENTCVTRIIYYMQDMLYNDPRFRIWQHYNLDFEYNKSTEGLKDINTNARYIKPDLLLHIRLNNNHNLLVVEFKKDQKSSENDKIKVRALTNQHQRYRYKLGCVVSLKKQFVTYQFVRNDKLGETITHYFNR